MSYIWHVIIKAIQDSYDPTKIHYRLNRRVSPYIEYIPYIISKIEPFFPLEKTQIDIDICPYVRFETIFREILFPPQKETPNDSNKEIVCDITTHILADIDRMCGMCERDFQVMLLMRDIDRGCYGDAKTASLLTIIEKRAVAETLIMLYKTSDSIKCLSILFSMILTDFTISNKDNSELVFFNPKPFDEYINKKLKFIISMFLPIDRPYVIHWRYTYGIIDCEETILIEEFVL